MLPLIGGVVLLAIVGLLFAMGGGDKNNEGGGGEGTTTTAGMPNAGTPNAGEPAGAGNPTPAAPTGETLADVRGDMKAKPPITLKDYEGYIRRLKALGEDGEADLKLLYLKGVNETKVLYDHTEARKSLGYTEFKFNPDDYGISFLERDFIQAAIQAARKQWYGPDDAEDLALANEALAAVEEHAEKLKNDPVYRVGNQVYSHIKTARPYLKQYNFSTLWAEPYLICYATKERVTEYDLMELDPRERASKREEMARNRRRHKIVLKEKGRIYQQMYKRFMEVYAERLGLKPLMDPWGGRADLPTNFRSYKDGCPMVVWIFENKAAWTEYHNEVKGEPIPEFAAAYFESKYGWVYCYDEGDGNQERQWEVGKNIHEGSHQLQFWFNRQMLKWREPFFQQDWLGEGLAELFGAVNMDKARNLTFHGINVPRLKSMRTMNAGLFAERDGGYPIFPINLMIQFRRYSEMQNWGAREWQIPGGLVMGLFYQQSWAFMHFLHYYEDGKYREQFNRYFDAFLRRPQSDNGKRAFRQAFGFQEDEDFEEIQEEFEKYVREYLMKEVDISKYEKAMPAIDDWGDEDPTDD